MSVSELNTELEYLSETKSQIKTAIINKGQDIIDTTPFRDYVGKINDISTLQADTADATATNTDISINKTAYVNGQKITGTLPLFPNTSTFTVSNAGVTDNTEDSTLDLTTINTTKQILDSNVSMNFNADYSDVATAIGITANKIVAGNTILGIEGTANVLPENASIYEAGDDCVEGGSNNPIKIVNNYLTFKSKVLSPIYLEPGSYISVNYSVSGVVDWLGLTPDKIVQGNTILGVEGTATTGTTADITIPQDEYGLETATSGEGDNDTGFKFYTNANTQSKLYENGSIVEMHITNELLAQVLGITADKIKKDEVICGITGTYEATVEAQAQIATLTQENQTLNTTIDDSNELAEDILGTATN